MMLMNTKWTLNQLRYSLLLLAGTVAFGSTAVYGQDAPSSDYNQNSNMQDNGEQSNYDGPENGQDPPTRVARLSFVDGSVSFQPGGQGDWAQAMRNRPVTIGDKIWADNNARAEIQAGQASIHLSSTTALSFLNMDDQITQMRLAEGTINVRVRELREGDVYEIDTPNLTFNVTEAGAFRIDVDENGDSTGVTAIRGEGEVTANGQTYTIHAGERGEFNGVDDNVTYFATAAPEPDEFDQWSNDRDLREDNSVSARFVSRDVPGYSDLDDNGSWNEEPDYGPVWYPNTVNVGWAPYSYGYWNYVGPWGWTWVGYEPWGFAPFHYGRWAFVGGAWGWCPGPVYARPFYGPAFVGFVGGGGFNVGFGFGGGWGGGIGWFPLGWGEPYHPWYHTSNVYVRNVNITNTRITNVNVLNNSVHNNYNYAYAHNVRAVTAASRSAFVNGQAIKGSSMRVTEASLRGAQVSNGASFSPNKASFTGAANAHGRVATPPSSVANRSVVARTAPAAAASHTPVRTMNSQGLSAGRGGNAPGNVGANRPGNSSAMSSRQGQVSNNRPPSANTGFGGRASVNGNSSVSANRPASGSRTRTAQGNATESGRAPQGFGSRSSSNRPSNGASQSAPAARSDRPPWAGSSSRSTPNGFGANGAGSRPASPSYSGANRSYQPQSRPSAPSYSNNRPSYSNCGGSNGGGRSYEPPSRASSRGTSYAPSYSAPSRNYSAPSYSAPSRSYSAPSRSYSAPSRSYGGGGGSNRGGGGGGGGSHNSGGGGGSNRGGGGGGGGSHNSGGGGSSHGGG